MTYVEQDPINPLSFRVAVPIDSCMFASMDILTLDAMRLPRLTIWEQMKPHQRTSYRKIMDGVQSMHLFQVMWDVDAIAWAKEHDPEFDFNLSGWLPEADECITITFKNRDAAMLFKLAWEGVRS